MIRGPDAATLLERAMLANAARAGAAATVSEARSARWASATFTGARHELMLEGLRSSAVDAWLDGLEEADLPMRGHLVADLKLTRVERSAERFCAAVEALTVEER